MRLSKAESSLSQTQSKLTETQAQLSQTRTEFTDSQAAAVHYHSKLSQAENFLIQLQTTLADERRLRKEAEDAIADVRRECMKPFVVPSLLDAFVELSKLTTRATVSAQRGAVQDEKERRREKGKSVDMGPPPDPALQQQKAPSVSQSSTMEKKAGDIQPRHTTATTATIPMNVGEALPRQILLPKPMSAPEDVNIHFATPSGQKITSLLPNTMTVEGSSARLNDGNNIAPEISSDVDMAAIPPTETAASLGSSSVPSIKGYAAPSQASSESVLVQPGRPSHESQQSPITAGGTSSPNTRLS